MGELERAVMTHHEKRLELIEQRLVDLAMRCWTCCGLDFAKELADEIKTENKKHRAELLLKIDEADNR